MLKINEKQKIILISLSIMIFILLLSFAFLNKNETTSKVDVIEKKDEHIIKKKENPKILVGSGEIDSSKYDDNSFATYIQKNKDDDKIIEMFQGKVLSEEFCFVDYLDNNIDYEKNNKYINEIISNNIKNGELNKDEINNLILNNTPKKSKIICIIPAKRNNNSSNLEDDLNKLKRLYRNDNIYSVNYEKLEKNMKVMTIIQNFGNGSYKKLTQSIKDDYDNGTIDKELVSIVPYIYGLEGNYEKNEEIIKNNCEKYKVQCYKDFSLSIKGTVVNTEGNPVKNATIEIISDKHIGKIFTDNEGKYSFTYDSYNFSKVRIKASKVGYSEGVIPLDVYGSKNQIFDSIDFTLASPTKVVTLNNKNKTFIGDNVTIKNNNFVVKTNFSTYFIPLDSFVYKDGTKFKGELDAFLFEFDKNSGETLNTLIRNDTFDEVVGYAGNIMKTFGMPFMLLKTKEGESIHILKSNPVILQNQISEMNALRTNQDKIYKKLSNEDLKYLYNKSKELGGYPITRDFLINPDKLMVHFPAFWIFDQKVGIWENIGIKLLDTKGLIEVFYYTLNDKK